MAGNGEADPPCLACGDPAGGSCFGGYRFCGRCLISLPKQAILDAVRRRRESGHPIECSCAHCQAGWVEQEPAIVEKPDADRTPDLIQPIVGFRSWSMTKTDQLFSSSLGKMLWRPGPNRAVCRAAHIDAQQRSMIQYALPSLPSPSPSGEKEIGKPAHTAPASECGCGFYAFHGFRSDLIGWSRAGYVIGAVIAWGDIEIHRDGFRAEYAQIVALGLPDIAAVSPAQRKGHERIAARYGVPLVPLVQLEEEGRRHGIRVPWELLPEEKKPPLGAGVQAPPNLWAGVQTAVATTRSFQMTVATTQLQMSALKSQVGALAPRSRLPKVLAAAEFVTAALMVVGFVIKGDPISLVFAIIFVAFGIWILRR